MHLWNLPPRLPSKRVLRPETSFLANAGVDIGRSLQHFVCFSGTLEDDSFARHVAGGDCRGTTVSEVGGAGNMIGDTISTVLLWILKVDLVILAAIGLGALALLARDSLRRLRGGIASNRFASQPVPDAVKSAASGCPHSLSCIEKGTCGSRPMCEIAYAEGSTSLVLISSEEVACPYRAASVHGQTCSCPVHCHLNAVRTRPPEGAHVPAAAPQPCCSMR